MRRPVCVVTGTRAEYGILRRLMRLLAESDEFQLQVVVAGMHLSPEFGLTVRQVEGDGFKVAARIDMLFDSDSAAAMAKGVGAGVYGMAQAFEMLGSEVIVVLGDRVEAFAAGCAGALSNLWVAHVHGGDKTRGGLDEPMRHAITRFAHIHFAATEASAERVVRMGEDPSRVFVVGAPGLDEILTSNFLSREELGETYSLEPDAITILLVQHPVSTEPENAGAQIRETLEAIRTLGMQTVVICPNSDPGGRAMLGVIAEYEDLPFVRVLRSVDRLHYLSLLRHCQVLVGNSSSGIIEAPFVGTPVVNVGTRQSGRELPGEILQARYDRGEIAEKIRKAIFDPAVRRSLERIRHVYGDGHASERIVEHLRRFPFDDATKQKTLCY